MDDIFEQMLSSSPWVDAVGNAMVDTMGSSHNFPKMMPSAAPLITGIDNQGLHAGHEHPDALFDTHQDHLQLRGVSRRPSEANNMVGLPQRQSAQSFSLMGGHWQDNYAGFGAGQPSPVSHGRLYSPHPARAVQSEDLHPSKRIRGDDDTIMSSNGQPQATGDQTQNSGTNGPLRPRVRARRGQATDPHSIAERNRRERISERMKALQELVPDSNKTDKASMLDEIINYVKFLQMQVKCLSMCRLGGAGVAAAPLLADIPAEGAANFISMNFAQVNGAAAATSQDGIAFAERQVARLMDEDMSAAMQYLQSKGLCLMPISLATAISSSGVRHHEQVGASGKNIAVNGDEKLPLETQILAAATGAAAFSKSDVDMKGMSMKSLSEDMPSDKLMKEEDEG
ncbi:hypothetical protein KP509_19G069900 [Ceratopteris richardii]|uniref:BHLH domain-containing protein n=1 Tax=Ceratopteris richardii TaxID=49495 RepID=A0A8T2SN11_CERRI|nr:hypothetical protein KP509_19G069900 [Ceratopteris richardii]